MANERNGGGTLLIDERILNAVPGPHVCALDGFKQCLYRSSPDKQMSLVQDRSATHPRWPGYVRANVGAGTPSGALCHIVNAQANTPRTSSR